MPEGDEGSPIATSFSSAISDEETMDDIAEITLGACLRSERRRSDGESNGRDQFRKVYAGDSGPTSTSPRPEPASAGPVPPAVRVPLESEGHILEAWGDEEEWRKQAAREEVMGHAISDPTFAPHRETRTTRPDVEPEDESEGSTAPERTWAQKIRVAIRKTRMVAAFSNAKVLPDDAPNGTALAPPLLSQQSFIQKGSRHFIKPEESPKIPRHANGSGKAVAVMEVLAERSSSLDSNPDQCRTMPAVRRARLQRLLQSTAAAAAFANAPRSTKPVSHSPTTTLRCTEGIESATADDELLQKSESRREVVEEIFTRSPSDSASAKTLPEKYTANTALVAFGKAKDATADKNASPAAAGKAKGKLRNAALRVTLVSAFNDKSVLSSMASIDPAAMTSTSSFSTLKALKVMLVSEKTSEQIVDLTYDYRKLRMEVKNLLKAEQTEEKAFKGIKEKMRKAAAQKRTDPDEVRQRLKATHSATYELDRETRRTVLGFGMNKEEFVASLSKEASSTANRVVIARLMEALSDISTAEEQKQQHFPFLNFYTCIDPDSTFITLWTVMFFLLICYISSYGLYSATFLDITVEREEHLPLVSECGVVTFLMIVDACVDGFFVLDILLRLFVFGQVAAEVAGGGSARRVILVPGTVCFRYCKTGLLVDAITGVPMQWLIMAFPSDCSAGGNASSSPDGLLMVRALRLLRITRVVKLFKSYQIRLWVKKIQRWLGNTNTLQLFNIIALLLIVNHFWCCLGWLVHSIDAEGFVRYQEYLGIRDGVEEVLPSRSYGLSFMNTLQTLFAIQSVVAYTTLEAWFGSLTILLSMVISATMLSKIIELWESSNRIQTERDNQINAVASFMAHNNIDGELRDGIFDYFDFRYANPYVDFEKRFLDELPLEMQYRVIHKLFPKALSSSNLFKNTTDAFISQCVIHMARNPVRTVPGQVIAAEGTTGAEMYLLKQGNVQVTVAEASKIIVVSVLEPGQCFGELSLWMEARRTATVTSVDFCHLYMLRRNDMEQVLKSFPEMAAEIATQSIAPCLRTTLWVPELRGISIAASERIARRMAANRLDFNDGDVICEEGLRADMAFVFRKGGALAEFCEGRLEGINSETRCIGFAEMLAGTTYQETVRAKGAVTLYSLDQSELSEVFEQDPAALRHQRRVAEDHVVMVNTIQMQLRWHLLVDGYLSLAVRPGASRPRRFSAKESVANNGFLQDAMAQAFQGTSPNAPSAPALTNLTDQGGGVFVPG